MAEGVPDVVRAHGAFLVEDDRAHDFGITTAALPVAAGDDSGHVAYLRSLKSVSPGIRVAAVIIAAGTGWFPAEPTGPFIRLNYAGPNPSAFPEGARLLGRSMELNGR